MARPFPTNEPSQDELDLIQELEDAAVHGETKNEAFLRLVNKRLPAAVKRIRLLGNLANTQNYEYTPEQARTVINVLTVELEKLERGYFGSDGDDIPTIG